MDKLTLAIENYREALQADMELGAKEEKIRAQRSKTRNDLSIARDELRNLETELRSSYA